MKLKYNKPIKKRNFTIDKYNEIINITYRHWKSPEGISDDVKYINVWFHYLKLLLEMEEKKIPLIKENIVSTGEKVVGDSFIGKDIQIRKDYYKGWSLDSVLTDPFSKWWKTHKFLFGTAITSEIKDKSDWIDHEGMTHIRVDRRKTDSQILKDIKEILREKEMQEFQKHSVKNISNSTYDKLVFQYNVIVRTLNGEKPEEIFLNEKERFKLALGILSRTPNDTRKKIGGKYRKFSSAKEYTIPQLWENYVKWWKIRDEPNYEVRTITVQGQTIHPTTYKGGLEKKFFKQLDDYINRTVYSIQDVLMGVSQGFFIKRIKFKYNPKTGKREPPDID